MNKDLLLGLGIGFFGGVLVGGLTALLLAPVSGEEMRGEIRDRAVESGASYLRNPTARPAIGLWIRPGSCAKSARLKTRREAFKVSSMPCGYFACLRGITQIMGPPGVSGNDQKEN